MDSLISQFLSLGTAIIAIIVVIVGFFVRRVIEITWPSLKPLAKELDSKPMYSGKAALWYNSIGLYALPVVLGGLVGVFTKDPYLFSADIKTTAGRVFYGSVVGWFADFLYEVIQKSLYKTTGVELPDAGASIPPVKPNV